MDQIHPASGGSTSSGDERIARAQELSAERVRNGALQVEVASLEARLTAAEARRDRANTVRFLALCLLVLIGLGGVLYLQIDSRGSGQLRAALIAQCQDRNANVVATRTGLQQQAMNNMAAGQTEYAEVWRNLADSLVTVDCGTLR